MSLSLTQSKTAIGPSITASFLGAGGTSPYVYSILNPSGGPGGSINSGTGLYTAPSAEPSDPAKLTETIRVTDALGAVASATILVGSPLLLFCDVVQKELGLSPGRVYLWDQKIMQPTDNGLYVAVSVLTCKPFSNVNWFRNGDEVQTVNMLATLAIDVISRGPAARDRKEEVIMALNSVYAQQQQEQNSFYIGKLTAGQRFINLSNPDGAAIPYRFQISVNLQYAVTKTKAVPYFDDFEDVEVNTDP